MIPLPYDNISMIFEILISPKKFFEERSKKEPSLKLPALIVAVIGIITIGSSYPIGEMTGRMMAGIMPGLELITSISTAIGSFVTTWIIWLVATIVLFIMVLILKGQYSFKRMAEVAGVGMTPLIINGIFNLIMAFWYIPKVHVNPITITDPTRVQELVNGLFHDPMMMEYTLISSIIGIIFIIWCVNICAIGLNKTGEFNNKKAIIAAGVPGILYILFQFYSLMTTYGLI